MSDLNHKPRGRRPNRVERLGRFASRARRLAFESLEQRGMLAAVIGAPPADCEMPVPADAEPPVGDEAAVAEDFAIAECWITPPGDDVAPPTIELPIGEIVPEDGTDWLLPVTDGTDPIPEWIEGDDRIRCGTHLVMQGLGNYLVGQYREFVKQNPTWPEEHGAGGIQLMVITPSKLCRWAQLSTPGEAQSFDAWYEQVFLNNAPVDPPSSIDDGTVTVADDNLFSPDLNSDLPVPVAAPTSGSDSTPKPAGTAAMSVADAAWAGLFTSQANAESTGSTPVGGRRRSR